MRSRWLVLALAGLTSLMSACVYGNVPNLEFRYRVLSPDGEGIPGAVGTLDLRKDDHTETRPVEPTGSDGRGSVMVSGGLWGGGPLSTTPPEFRKATLTLFRDQEALRRGEPLGSWTWPEDFSGQQGEDAALSAGVTVLNVETTIEE